jgi:predicted proteasome-type protease
MRYETDSFSTSNMTMLKDDDPYWNALRNAYGDGLTGLVNGATRP